MFPAVVARPTMSTPLLKLELLTPCAYIVHLFIQSIVTIVSSLFFGV